MNGGTKTAEKGGRKEGGREESRNVRIKREGEARLTHSRVPICRWTTKPRRREEEETADHFSEKSEGKKKGNDVGSGEAKSILTGNQYFTFLGSFFAAAAIAFSAFFQLVFPKWQH